jgi:hypothetical protein
MGYVIRFHAPGLTTAWIGPYSTSSPSREWCVFFLPAGVSRNASQSIISTVFWSAWDALSSNARNVLMVASFEILRLRAKRGSASEAGERASEASASEASVIEE